MLMFSGCVFRYISCERLLANLLVCERRHIDWPSYYWGVGVSGEGGGRRGTSAGGGGGELAMSF